MKSALDLKQERHVLHSIATGQGRKPSRVVGRLTGSVTKYLPVSGYGMVKSAPRWELLLPGSRLRFARLRPHVRGRADLQIRPNNARISG